MKRTLIASAVAVVATLLITGPYSAFGTHTPANKAVASGSKIEEIAPGTNKVLMQATLRTSKPQDLLIGVNLECTILTSLITGGENAESSTARGEVRVWTELDGNIVPINTISSGRNEAPAPGDETDKITFCDRTYSRSVTDTENDDDGTDTESDFIRTKSAHSFQWVRLNAGSGVHTIVVKADLTVNTAGDAVAEAIVGNRTLIVEPERFANDASV